MAIIKIKTVYCIVLTCEKALIDLNLLSFMWQVVKFTKSFELLSPKCSAEAENR